MTNAATPITADLRSALDLMTEIFEAAPVGLIVADTRGIIRLLNREAESLFGYARDALIGEAVECLVPDAYRAGHQTLREAYAADPKPRPMGRDRPLFARRRDGTLVPVEIALKPLQVGQWRLILSVIMDVTVRRRLEDEVHRAHDDLEQRVLDRTVALRRANEENVALLHELEQQKADLELLSRQDPLTGLANRRDFDQQLQVEIRRCERAQSALAVAMLDLDLFKRVNDEFGHAMGDVVLRTVATLIREHCRPFDRVCRYGGEEFALALPDAGPQDGITICDRIRRAIECYDWTSLQPGLRVTISAGVCAWHAGLSPAELLAGADMQLYRAKRAGRNRVMPES
ncbi:sensor domain-containing diguanylate cyclase [Tahibacter amnicola]|uniref:diguanylate cyclase n=1 Tax=Tahibacter amnicola TaxID=2976241 RepID=A0ABY6BDQ0_9GAMM|nr:sensor domain-containing diguanylate cyclase [Tahibacter amnicola]UXI66460.1 sensor domain-containing diguanylate cyclase [Tahibacter amnicola]